MIAKPENINTSDYFAGYVKMASGEDLIDSLMNSLNRTLEVYGQVDEEKGNFAYADKKWTLKQILQHLIDTERVFTYRALRFGRNDITSLMGYDENFFADNDFANERRMSDIILEFKNLRYSTIDLYTSLHKSVLDNAGTANEVNFTPSILGWVIAGHTEHHLNVVEDKYL